MFKLNTEEKLMNFLRFVKITSALEYHEIPVETIEGKFHYYINLEKILVNQEGNDFIYSCLKEAYEKTKKEGVNTILIPLDLFDRIPLMKPLIYKIAIELRLGIIEYNLPKEDWVQKEIFSYPISDKLPELLNKIEI